MNAHPGGEGHTRHMLEIVLHACQFSFGERMVRLLGLNGCNGLGLDKPLH